MYRSIEPKPEIKTASNTLVISGSIAGLLAARVLVNHFDKVTIVESDRFPAQPSSRPGVPHFIANRSSLTGFSPRFQKRLALLNATRWLMTTGADLRWLTTEGGQPNGIQEVLFCQAFI